MCEHDGQDFLVSTRWTVTVPGGSIINGRLLETNHLAARVVVVVGMMSTTRGVLADIEIPISNAAGE